ncbi:MAG: hypothetical protein ACFE8A_13325 [Candidatus Hodarchaeota archaeon]
MEIKLYKWIEFNMYISCECKYPEKCRKHKVSICLNCEFKHSLKITGQKIESEISNTISTEMV